MKPIGTFQNKAGLPTRSNMTTVPPAANWRDTLMENDPC
jgi:hypothetical protein